MVVELTAFVFSHGQQIPHGTVVFCCEGRTLGNARLDMDGIARLQIRKELLGRGTHYVTAFFAGNREFQASVSEATVRLVE